MPQSSLSSVLCQEAHLSRRLLFFTHIQPHFKYAYNVFCEDAVGENRAPSALVVPGPRHSIEIRPVCVNTNFWHSLPERYLDGVLL